MDLAETGDLVHYTVTVANSGSSRLRDVSVVDLVPLEVDVVSVAISPDVQATELGKTGRKEDIVWQVGPMDPGTSLRLTWTGKVVGLSGFDAVNTVHARSDFLVSSATSTTYLAAVHFVGTTNPAYHSTRTVTTFEPATATEASGSATSAASDNGAGGLPFTGFVLTPLLIVAMGLVLAGATALLVTGTGDRSRRVKAVIPVAALVVLTACVSSSQAPSATPSVKGRHITKSSPAPQVTAKSGRSHDHQNSGASNASAPSPAPVAPGSAVAAPSPVASVPVTHVIPVTAADLPVEAAPATKGSDFMTYTWNAQGGYIAAATSTRTFSAEDVSITGHMTSSSGVIHVRLAVANLASAQRIALSGHVDLSITGPTSTTLTSPVVDVVLTPGGAAHLAFDYALPSGTYGTSFTFVPTRS